MKHEDMKRLQAAAARNLDRITRRLAASRALHDLLGLLPDEAHGPVIDPRLEHLHGAAELSPTVHMLACRRAEVEKMRRARVQAELDGLLGAALCGLTLAAVAPEGERRQTLERMLATASSSLELPRLEDASPAKVLTGAITSAVVVESARQHFARSGKLH